jgi:hypothetical protein
MNRLILTAGFLAVLTALSHAAWPWQPANGSSNVQATPDGAVSLTLTAPGEASASAGNLPVTAGQNVVLSFDYTASGLSPAQPLELSVHWYNAAGEDLDATRLQLGFPPFARTWQFTHNGATPTHVSDNLAVPSGAAKAVFALRLARGAEKEAMTGTTRVRASNFDLHEGEAEVTGIELPDSGPADAGPVSAPPAGITFATNLVPNGDLEDGTEVPAGWKIEGNNVNGSAEWAQGGAYSGKRAFKLYDRGPYVKSWDRQPGDPVIAGGPNLNGDAAHNREEVSARWVSDPVPAQPGTAYQASAFYWYANRTFLDRAIINPITIQFLDAKQKPLRHTTQWDDWFPDSRVITRPGWVLAPSKVLVAPPGTAFVRAEVKMFHAMVNQSAGAPLNEIPGEHRMILVDNISLYALPPGMTALTPADQAFAAAATARALPFVPSSPQHRPNSILVSSHADNPGGLIIRPYDQTTPNHLSLDLTNLLGDVRQPQVSYDIVDINNKTVLQGQGSAALGSFAQGSAAVDIPASLPYGPYLVRYSITESGSNGAVQGEARFGIMPPRLTTLAERSRMDYPFSLWMPFPVLADPVRADTLGELAKNAGVGTTWFGADGIYLEHFVRIKDATARQAVIDKQIATCRAAIAFWKKHDIKPLGRFEPPQLLDPSLNPVLADVVKQFVTALKADGIDTWRYGTESIHGGIHDIDQTTMPGVNGWGGHDIMGWGMKGSERQYWATYLVAFKAAKEADPHCFFGPNSASDVEGTVLHSFFQLMPPSDMDGFGMNTYISAFSIWPPNERELRINHVPNLPIYASEFAAAGASPTKPGHLDDEHATSRHEVTYWTSILQAFPNFFHLEQWGMILGNDDGSLTYEGQVRPLYLAYAAMTNLLGSGKFIARHDLPGIEIFVRQRSVQPGYATVVYATGEDRPVDLDAGPHPVVYDLWGNRSEPAVADGVLTVQATHDPVYIVSDSEVRPHAGVAISVDPGTLDPDHPRVTVTLKNETKEPAPGQLELIQAGPLEIGDRVRAVSALAPGQTLTFDFEVKLIGDLPHEKLPITVRYTVGQKTYELPVGINFDTARKAHAPLTINADPSGWNAAEFSLVADQPGQFFGNGSPKPWGGPDDISGRTAFRWDEHALYVFFKVTDDVDMPPPALNHMFDHDCIELFINVTHELTSNAPFTMFALARLPDGPKIQRYDGTLPAGNVPGAKIAARREGNVAFYEAAIPWNEISPGFTPHAGQAISVNWWLDDFDGGDTGVRKLFWYCAEKDPAHFGDLTLVDNRSTASR